MLKVNKKLILLLVLVLITSILSGCKSKAPEGVSQDFYDDMIVCINNVKNTDTTKDDGYSNILKYEKVKNTLSDKEQNILNAMDDIYTFVLLNKDSDDLFVDDISEQLAIFRRLMDIDIEIGKIK